MAAIPSPAGSETRRSPLRLPRPVSLAIVTMALAVVAIGLGFGFPVYQRHRAIREFYELGGSVTEQEAGPQWLRRWIGKEAMRRCGFDDVTSIDLAGTEATDATLRLVARFRELNDINLDGTQITDAGLESLRTLKNLESVSLAATGIGDQGLARLAELNRLNDLSLAGTRVSAAGLSLFRRTSSLETLDLRQTHAVNQTLAEISNLRSLRALKLGGCCYGDAGLKRLHALSGLERLDLGEAKVTRAAVVRLQEAIPALSIVWEWRYALGTVQGELTVVTDWITFIFEGAATQDKSSGTFRVSGNSSELTSHWSGESRVSFSYKSGMLVIECEAEPFVNSDKKPHRRAELTRSATRLTCGGRTVKLPAARATLVFSRDGTVSLNGRPLAELEEVPP